MKRIIAVLLMWVIAFGLLAGCEKAPADAPVTSEKTGEPETTQVPMPTQSAEEQEILRILTIGNSHSNDANQMLWEVFQNEMPEQKVMLGVLYYSGCNMSQHYDYITKDKPEYTFWTNDDGYWTSIETATASYALQNYQWDVVVMQQMNHRLGMEDNFVAEHWKTVINYVLNNQKVKPRLMFHVTWTNPDDYALYLNDDAPLNNPEPANWRNSHEKYFGGTDGTYDQSVLYDEIIRCVKKYLVDTTDFLGVNYYDDVIPSVTAVEYAQDVQGRPQPEIYRDYTHMNDYGRVLVAYLWYAKIMGLDSLNAVNLGEIPQALHHNRSEYPFVGNLQLDQQMKDDIIASVNWALANPFTLPEATISE